MLLVCRQPITIQNLPIATFKLLTIEGLHTPPSSSDVPVIVNITLGDLDYSFADGCPFTFPLEGVMQRYCSPCVGDC